MSWFVLQIDDSLSPCIGVLRHCGIVTPTSAWALAAILVEVYNPSEDDNSPPQSPIISTATLKRKLENDDADSFPVASKRRRWLQKGVGSDSPENLSCGARFSDIELVNGYYSPWKRDKRLDRNAERVFRATGTRRHVLGIDVHGPMIRFHLYDHAGTIYTTPLDIRVDTKQLIQSVLSVAMLDPVSLGLEPTLCDNMGRSSRTILPNKGGFYIDVDDTSFYAESLLHAGSLYGRGTAVYEAMPVVPAIEGPRVSVTDYSCGVPDEVVLKISWQLPSSRSEDALLRLAEERGAQGIAKLYKSTILGRLSDGLRGRLVPATMYADRELRVQVLGPRAKPLAQVEDKETFKTAFRSLVAGGYAHVLIPGNHVLMC
jgi:hypothetical protein